MTVDSPPELSKRLQRAVRRRCPHCGEVAFDTYFTLKDRCQRCRFRFEREPGYWVGATIINTTVIFGTFLTAFGAGIWLTWPDVPWTALLIALGAVNLLVPIAFYPLSKTIWLALEMGWNPIEPAEFEDEP